VSSQDNRESSDCSLSESFTSPSCTLGVDLRRGRRRFSGNLQLPPLSWRQGERSRTPDDEVIARPTSLPFGAPPRIDITPVDPEWYHSWKYQGQQNLAEGLQTHYLVKPLAMCVYVMSGTTSPTQ
ncbi:unnamed protein product, partial [Tetraodon nigroviridis]